MWMELRARRLRQATVSLSHLDPSLSRAVSQHMCMHTPAVPLSTSWWLYTWTGGDERVTNPQRETLPITKQYPCPHQSCRQGGTDGTPDTNRISYAGYETAESRLRRKQLLLWTLDRLATRQHSLNPERSFQFTAYMGSANPTSIEALRVQ